MDEADELLARIARHLEAFDQQRYFPGMDQYKVYFGQVVSLLEYLPGDTLLVLDEPVRLKEAAVGASMEIGEHFSQLLRKGRILSSLADLYWDWNSLWAKFQTYRPVHLSTLGKRVSGMETLSSTPLSLRMPEHFGGKIERMLRRVQQLRRDHYRILILVSTKERGQRILELLREEEIPAVYVDQLGKELQVGNCVITTGSLETGFEFPAFKLSVITELELTAAPAKARAPKVEEGLRIAPTSCGKGTTWSTSTTASASTWASNSWRWTGAARTICISAMPDRTGSMCLWIRSTCSSATWPDEGAPKPEQTGGQ